MITRILTLFSIALLTTSCYFGDPGVATQSELNTYDLIGLSADETSPTDSTNVAGDWNTTTLTAPYSNKGNNTRIGFTVNAPNFDWNETCATWKSHTGYVDQPGHVLHFDGTRAITVTQNIYGGARNIANVHLWDLSKSVASGQRFTLLKSFTLSSLNHEWPIRSCAQAQGSTINYKAWAPGTPEPAWGDSCCSFSTTVSYTGPGRPGWFAGHVLAGGTMIYNDMYLHAI